MIAEIEKMGGSIEFSHKSEWWPQLLDTRLLDRAEGLCLNDSQVSDLSPLVELKNLRDLSVWNTRVSDVSPLAHLKNLELCWPDS